MSTQPVPGTLLGWVELRNEDEEAAWRDVWAQNVYQLGPEHLEGAVVIDVGSNIGLFTAFALHHNAAMVLAVDPIQEHHDRARTLIGDKQPVEWITAAAGDGSARSRGPGVGPSQTMIAGNDVVGITLDELVARVDRAVKRLVLKLDCEGAEFDVLESASDDTLRRIWRIAGEWHGMMGAVRQSAEGRIGQMVERLIHTHSVTIFGDPDTGGMIFCYRY